MKISSKVTLIKKSMKTLTCSLVVGSRGLIKRTALLGMALLITMLFVSPAHSQSVSVRSKIVFTGTYADNTCFVTLADAIANCGCDLCNRFDFVCSSDQGKRTYATALTAVASRARVQFATQVNSCRTHNNLSRMTFAPGKNSYFLILP